MTMTTMTEDQRYINLNPGRLFVQQPSKNGKGLTGSFKLLCLCLQQGETTITPLDKTKPNMTKTSTHPYTYNTKLTHTKTKARFSRILRHLAWKQSGTILVEWEVTEKQENRRSE